MGIAEQLARALWVISNDSFSSYYILAACHFTVVSVSIDQVYY